MAPDHLKAIRGFFYMFHLPIVSAKEDTVEQVWNIVAAGVRRYSSIVFSCVVIFWPWGIFILENLPRAFFCQSKFSGRISVPGENSFHFVASR